MHKIAPRWFQVKCHEVKRETHVFSAPMLVSDGNRLVVKQKV